MVYVQGSYTILNPPKPSSSASGRFAGASGENAGPSGVENFYCFIEDVAAESGQVQLLNSRGF